MWKWGYSHCSLWRLAWELGWVLHTAQDISTHGVGFLLPASRFALDVAMCPCALGTFTLAHKRWQRCSQPLLHGGCRKVLNELWGNLVTSRSGYLQKQLVPKKSKEKWNDALWGVLGPSYSGSLPEVQRMPVVISGAAWEEGTELMVMSLVDFFPEQISFWCLGKSCVK